MIFFTVLRGVLPVCRSLFNSVLTCSFLWSGLQPILSAVAEEHHMHALKLVGKQPAILSVVCKPECLF